jgi:hypothetical protein
MPDSAGLVRAIGSMFIGRHSRLPVYRLIGGELSTHEWSQVVKRFDRRMIAQTPLLISAEKRKSWQ